MTKDSKHPEIIIVMTALFLCGLPHKAIAQGASSSTSKKSGSQGVVAQHPDLKQGAKSRKKFTRRSNVHTAIGSTDSTTLIGMMEKLSWSASPVIDDLLTAVEQMDSNALNRAMSRLYDMQPEGSGILSDDVRKANIFHDRGIAYFTQGKFGEALSNFQQALLANPTDISTFNDLVHTEIKTNDLKTAIMDAPAAISIAPSSTVAWCNMAEIFARVKQFSRARDCAYMAYFMSEDPDTALEIIKSTLKEIKQPDVRTPFREALLMAAYTPIDQDDSQDGNSKKAVGFIGPEMDLAFYKMNMLLLCAQGLQQIKPDSGILLAVTISRTGAVLHNELVHSAGDPDLDKTAINAVANARLPVFPKSVDNGEQQFLIRVDKVVKILGEV